jgi:DNA-binding NarL/FixJ family response regulator
MAPIQVVIAEDHLLMRAGIEALLAVDADRFRVVGTCSGYAELIDVASALRPDVVIADIRMPPDFRDEGIRAAAEIRRSSPEMGVIALSSHLSAGYLLELLADGSGRRGYLLKERIATANQLASAIEVVASGGSFIDPVVVDSLVHTEEKRPESPLRVLTRRERQTLAEVAQGRSNRAIAELFGVSERAIENHVGAIFTKLDLYDSRDINRRVKATLLFLSSSGEPGP